MAKNMNDLAAKIMVTGIMFTATTPLTMTLDFPFRKACGIVAIERGIMIDDGR